MSSRRKSFTDRPKTGLTPVEAATQRPDRIETLPPDKIELDPEIQVRVDGYNQEWVENFYNILDSGGELEPIHVFRVGDVLKVADGFHRLAAAIEFGAESIRCIIHDGTLEDAKEFAESANLEHGLYLSHDDKKNILWRRLERGHEWMNFSNNQIAAILGVSGPTIGNWIKELSTTKNFIVDRSQTVGADGKTRSTQNISGKSAPRPWTPKRAKSRIFKITQTLADDDLFSALNQLEDAERDSVFGQLYDLRKRIDELLGD